MANKTATTEAFCGSLCPSIGNNHMMSWGKLRCVLSIAEGRRTFANRRDYNNNCEYSLAGRLFTKTLARSSGDKSHQFSGLADSNTVSRVWNHSEWLATVATYMVSTHIPLTIWISSLARPTTAFDLQQRSQLLPLPHTCLEYPTCPRQALRRCCVPQRVGEGSGARLKPKSTTWNRWVG